VTRVLTLVWAAGIPVYWFLMTCTGAKLKMIVLNARGRGARR
jgi:hypothetical protein